MIFHDFIYNYGNEFKYLCQKKVIMSLHRLKNVYKIIPV
jgi:hypothetical protein